MAGESAAAEAPAPAARPPLSPSVGWLPTLISRLLALCYLFAFTSLLGQWRGLVGPTGVTPDANDASTEVTAGPSLLYRASLWLGMEVSDAGEVVSVVGAIFAAIAASSSAPRPALFGACYLLYSFLATHGGNFLSFQWDVLLLEAGFAAFLAFRSGSGRCSISGRWLLRFLAFKLTFSSGWHKINANCGGSNANNNANTWLDMSAMEVHFASQCLPTPAAWYAHNLPPGILRLGEAYAVWTLLCGSVLLLIPLESVAAMGALLQILLQISIGITGNYNFFNLLTIALCMTALPSFPSRVLASLEGKGSKGSKGSKSSGQEAGQAAVTPPRREYVQAAAAANDNDSIVAFLASSFEVNGPLATIARTFKRATQSRIGVRIQLLLVLIYSFITFSILYEWSPPATRGTLPQHQPPSPPWWHFPRIRFTRSVSNEASRLEALDSVLPWMCALAAAVIVVGVVWDVYEDIACAVKGVKALGGEGAAAEAEAEAEAVAALGAASASASRPSSSSSLPRKVFSSIRILYSTAWAIVTAAVVISTFSVSSMALLSLHPPLLQDVPSLVQRIYHFSAPYQVAGSYGLFRCMTGHGPKNKKDMYNLPIVTTQRPEVVLEGWWRRRNSAGEFLDDDEAMMSEAAEVGHWKQIPFLYKPGDVYASPPWVWPHQPRLDWQAWFSALGESYQESPWLVQLAVMITEGSPSVIGLLDTEAWPEKEKNNILVAPIAVRARLYHYDFTRSPSPHTPWGASRINNATLTWEQQEPASAGQASAAWWRRNLVKADFLPIISRGDGGHSSNPVWQYLQNFGWENSTSTLSRTTRRVAPKGSEPLSCDDFVRASARHAVRSGFPHMKARAKSFASESKRGTRLQSLAESLLSFVSHAPTLTIDVLEALKAALFGDMKDARNALFIVVNTTVTHIVPSAAQGVCESMNLLRALGFAPSEGYAVDLGPLEAPRRIIGVQPTFWGDNKGEHSPWFFLCAFVSVLVVVETFQRAKREARLREEMREEEEEAEAERVGEGQEAAARGVGTEGAEAEASK